MKKSKFLLLGSLSSLAAIPFVAAKCGDTKEDEKKPADKPADTQGGGEKNPKSPAESSMTDDKDKAGKDKTETEKTEKDKDNKKDGDSSANKDKNTEIDLSTVYKDLGYFPKDDKTKAVSQKDIRDKIVKILNGRQDFSLNVDYVNHKAKVTLANGQEIIFTFTDDQNSSNSRSSTRSRAAINFTSTPPNPLLSSTESEILDNLRLGKTVEESNRLATENSNAVSTGVNWNGVTEEEREKARESGKFWEKYWKEHNK
ncbi:Variable surface lipoprotein D1 (VpmaD1) [Mycoplasmopsis agalactiae 14628]|uniref:Variable surface lipoprotein D1 (VpmaD1) n=1 Tax=Mycoplasmopsis agalactiae 14628 TaxID=1110504 RepID=I5D623_MYCAA|nr:variable surface lipoprotein [Mycoplasmopsis agalactiae]EIN15132.1 Variable surface lipoprotein D1 (VpmaD1) [Mycoplasmopsis agalactiae 14628]